MIRVLRQQIRERLQSLLERNPVLTLLKQRLQAGQDQGSALGRQQKPRRVLGRTAAESTPSSNSTAAQRPHPRVGALGKTAHEEQTPLYGAINSVT